ncbi:MAG TPA: hypothetical protein VF060_27320, partial [Trebonia sp.]
RRPTGRRRALIIITSRRLAQRSQPRLTLGAGTPIVAFIGLTAAIADKAAWWWPFAVILVITGYGYLSGLSNYGVPEEDTPDDADAGHPTRSPVGF